MFWSLFRTNRALVEDFTLKTDLAALNRRIHRYLLDDHGVEIARFYHCPHHPTEALPEWRQQCHCRKPAPGMIEQACAELHIDPSSSLMVGDKASDMEAGRAAGVGRLFRVVSAAKATDYLEQK